MIQFELTDPQRRLLEIADREGYICGHTEERCPGVHFCPDWDFMPICIGSPEYDACTCVGPK